MEDKSKFIKSITPNRGRVGGQDTHNYEGMECPHCGAQTGIDPALVKDDDPMLYCPECDKPLFGDAE